MEKIKTLVKTLYRHNFVRYLFVGGTTFIIDEGILIYLHGHANIWLPLATFCSYIAAFIYNFSLNRWWSFSAAETDSLRSHIAPYSVLFVFNLIFAVVAVSLLSNYIHFAIAKPIVVIIQTTWTYYAYKNIIFAKAKSVPPLE